MLNIKDLIANKQLYINSQINRKKDPNEIENLIVLENQKKILLNELEKNRADKKNLTNNFVKLKKENKDTSEIQTLINNIDTKIEKLEIDFNTIELKFLNLILSIPNLISNETPIGDNETNNKLIKTYKEKPTFDFKIKDHVELGEKLDIIDFKKASKVSRSRFVFMKNNGAKLERALINFMLDIHTTEHAYKEIIPPYIVNSASLYGTGQLPKFEADLFKIQDEDLYLIPTAEVPLTNFYYDEILNEKDLPIKLVAYTPCFRSEAGSYGKDTKGMIRQHQFNKVELVKFVHPDHSFQEHDSLTNDAEIILQKLGLHYRVVSLCSADLGFAASKCYDLEVWLPSQNTYREISSCSNFSDFQARRAKIRYKNKEGKTNFVHTINGSALAVGRTVVAIMEQYQDKNGNIRIPDVLIKYMDGLEIIKN